jgi:hypothetical protein
VTSPRVFRTSQEVEESDGVEVLIDGGVAVVPSQKVKKQKSGSKKTVWYNLKK